MPSEMVKDETNRHKKLTQANAGKENQAEGSLQHI